MTKQAIITPHPPKYHFSTGIKTEQFIFIAGLVGHENPDTGEEIKGVEAQTKQCLENIKEVLECAGSSLNDVVNTTVYLVNRDDFLKMNAVYKTFFPKDPPARATIIVSGLVSPKMLVEIQCIAVVRHK
jgi:2-iminobutanoate/2-iminopropanoate deaminase